MPPTTAPASARKLPKPERREQLLARAQEMVREEGTEALTLARVAERAGVTKPVAYDHFGTREALMVELFRRIDDRQTALLIAALKSTEGRLDAVAATIAKAYMSCALAVGTEWYALSAALRGSEAMEAVQRELVARYAGIWREALAPHAARLAPDELNLRCIGLLGAAEAISLELLRGHVGEPRASATLAALVRAVVDAPASAAPL
ncbi:TetR/AcrR family transcriptional regulator [Bosea sp. CS1GBMeth4]|uniref:TetR/AcrR family transcriptional regulator n=1 Tax=Bosea sp. CS1GBMeth4 TaxID=1892849 RepID=UPI001FCEE4BF|nr:TetR/AcrR family transcriptional regulator [Bosea sp. CS1GBMeth4]